MTIKKGDTLSELAVKYKTTVANLKELTDTSPIQLSLVKQ
ncbi:hypothetical protein CHH55_20640 [Niallia circulans]|nr:hypothetical protein CHH62_21300 [Niallia circulans]PAD85948.1 hypothetical protein CHH55_20640 [Niallia circulans]